MFWYIDWFPIYQKLYNKDYSDNYLILLLSTAYKRSHKFFLYNIIPYVDEFIVILWSLICTTVQLRTSCCATAGCDRAAYRAAHKYQHCDVISFIIVCKMDVA